MKPLEAVRYSGLPTPLELILFDKITITAGDMMLQKVDQFTPNERSYVQSPVFLGKISERDYADLTYLVEKGIVNIPSHSETLQLLKRIKASYHEFVRQNLKEINILNKAINLTGDKIENKLFKENNPQSMQDHLKFMLKSVRINAEVDTRLWCMDLRKKNVDVFPVFAFPPTLKSIDKNLNTISKQRVLEVIFEKFALPGDDLSFEEILNYRNDYEIHDKLLRLRNFTRVLSKEKLTKNEIEDEIDWRIHQYESHMRRVFKKIKRGKIRLFLSTTANIVDNLASLKIKPIIDEIFKFQDTEMEIEEEERIAPGNEVAFIPITHSKYSF